MIIDAHIHLWNRLHGDDLGIERKALGHGRAEENRRVYYATPPSFDDSLSTYERALAHMDWLGIERVVVLQEFMDGKQDDYLAQVRRLCPQRFSCMALFDRHYLDDPLSAFAKAIDDKKLQGFLVKTPDPFAEIATLRLEPLWQICAERGLPVVLKDGTPAEIRKLVRLVPDLKLVLSHFGGMFGTLADWRERAVIAADSANVTFDAGAISYGQRYPFALAKERLQEAVETMGANKIAWGSDYPRPDLVADASYKQQLEFITIECDFLSAEGKEQLLSGTALRTYVWDA
jgi:predicted TIM-barrel fold metal-dependent hydrolase